jgi:hypothetical protein
VSLAVPPSAGETAVREWPDEWRSFQVLVGA